MKVEKQSIEISTEKTESMAITKKPVNLSKLWLQ